MENPEEILHSLEEFSKTKPKTIPPELEAYLCFVAKTGDPVYQWPAIKSLFKEKMISVITEFYQACPSVEVPPCPNVDMFNYDVMKTFILEKLDTFAAAPFTLQRICELLTTPRKQYNRIDKYMRALEKNILVVSTTEPGGRRTTENGEGIMNGLESEHLPETSNSSDINVEEMDDAPAWPRLLQNEAQPFQKDAANGDHSQVQEAAVTASKAAPPDACTSSQDTVITCRAEEPYVSIEPVPSNACPRQENTDESDVSVTITAIPAGVQKRRSSVEPVVSSDGTEASTESCDSDKSGEASKDADPKPEDTSSSSSSSSSQQMEDADSSSSTEDEKETEIVKETKIPDPVCDAAAAAPQIEPSSTEAEEAPAVVTAPPTSDSEVGTSEPVAFVEATPDAATEPSPEESSEVEGEAKPDDEPTVDTTKCSIQDPPQEVKEDVEITSSDDKGEEVDSSQRDLQEIKDIVENEANASEPKEESQREEDVTEKSDVCEKEEAPVQMEVSDCASSSSSVTPMEVDEDDGNSEKVEDVVRAEATSDSPL